MYRIEPLSFQKESGFIPKENLEFLFPRLFFLRKGSKKINPFRKSVDGKIPFSNSLFIWLTLPSSMKKISVRNSQLVFSDRAVIQNPE